MNLRHSPSQVRLGLVHVHRFFSFILIESYPSVVFDAHWHWAKDDAACLIAAAKICLYTASSSQRCTDVPPNPTRQIRGPQLDPCCSILPILRLPPAPSLRKTLRSLMCNKARLSTINLTTKKKKKSGIEGRGGFASSMGHRP